MDTKNPYIIKMEGYKMAKTKGYKIGMVNTRDVIQGLVKNVF